MNTANNNPKNQQAEIIKSMYEGSKLVDKMIFEEKKEQQAEITCYCEKLECHKKSYCDCKETHLGQPSEEKDTLPKIKPKKIDIKKLEGIVERYNSEEKVCDCATPGIHKCCPVHAPTEAGWDAKEWYSQLFDTDRDLYGKVKGLIAQVIKEERENLKQLILESMPEKINSVNKFYGKSEIEWGFENTYNKAIDDVTKVINDLFDGRE